MIIDYLIYIFTFLYFLEYLIFLYGLVKATKLKKNNNYSPAVSIIVAARNEESKILNCLKSLNNLNYPREKLDIIIVNDQSTDRTREIVEDFIRDKHHFKLINSEISQTNLKGKVNAITQGIDISKGEILLFTDADCTVPTDWVKETVSYFTENVGIVGGYTFLKSKKTFEGIQSLDWIYLFNIASSSATLGFPLTGIGNNLAFKKEYYNLVGGYRNIKFSVTEDYALTQEILKKTNAKMAFPLNHKTLITSLPCENILELYRQKKRWGVGGLDMIPMGFLVFSIPFILNILILINIFVLNIKILTLTFIIKALMDFLLLFYSTKKLGLVSYLKYFLLFEVYLFVYVTALPFIVMFSKEVVWKERKL